MARLRLLLIVLLFAFLCTGLVTAQTWTKALTFVRTTKLSGGASSLIGRVVDTPEVDETFDIPGGETTAWPACPPATYPSRQVLHSAAETSSALPDSISFSRRSLLLPVSTAPMVNWNLPIMG
jgi:hypothetical protein